MKMEGPSDRLLRQVNTVCKINFFSFVPRILPLMTWLSFSLGFGGFSLHSVMFYKLCHKEYHRFRCDFRSVTKETQKAI